MIAAVLLAVLCFYIAFRVGLRLERRRGPRIQRRPSRRRLRGDLWLWEQETRRSDR